MKIVKRNGAWWVGVRFTCPTCNARVELDENDTPDRAGIRDIEVYCPQCNRGLIVFYRTPKASDQHVALDKEQWES